MADDDTSNEGIASGEGKASEGRSKRPPLRSTASDGETRLAPAGDGTDPAAHRTAPATDGPDPVEEAVVPKVDPKADLTAGGAGVDSKASTSHRRKLLPPQDETIDIVSSGRALSGRYRLVREIARGGMGIVFEGEDLRLEGRRVAIKVLPPEMAKDESAIIRLKREAASVCRLEHPNVVRLIEYDADGELHYLVMEYLDGQNLAVYLAHHERIELDEVLSIATDVVEGLACAHDQKVVHRDVKPANLMFKTVGQRQVTKITDFGIAFQIKDSMTRLTGVESAGTLLYIAPEQLLGERPTASSDQYSLAATLYELLAGDPPFFGAGLSHQILEAPPKPITGMPPHVNEALLRALAKKPEDRFPDCRAFLAALKGAAGAAGAARGVASMTTTEASVPERARSGGGLSTFIAALAILFAGLLLYDANTGGLGIFRRSVATATVTATSTATSTAMASATAAAVTPTPSSTIAGLPVLITSEPSGAKVYCAEIAKAGGFLGRTEPSIELSLKPGQYHFSFMKAGYRSQSRIPRSIAGSSRVRVHAELQARKGTISLTVTPASARVTMNGTLETGRFLRLSPDTYSFRGTLEGFEPASGTVRLEDGASRHLALELREKPKGPRRGDTWTNSIGMKFVWISKGSFRMGSPSNEPGRDNDEGPPHQVTISKDFWLGTYEVTQAEWRAVMGNSPSYFKGDRRPVEKVSWNDCQEFCRKLSARDGGNTYRLPSEAEWEFACRAGTTTALYSGPIRIVGQRNAPALDPIAWYGGNSGTGDPKDYDSSKWPEKQYKHSRAGTHPVGEKGANAWGLHDMIGNVWEWCADGARGYPAVAVTDPRGPEGSNRVLRGGSWYLDARYCRSAYRLGHEPGFGNNDLGCRVVVSRPGAP